MPTYTYTYRNTTVETVTNYTTFSTVNSTASSCESSSQSYTRTQPTYLSSGDSSGSVTYYDDEVTWQRINKGEGTYLFDDLYKSFSTNFTPLQLTNGAAPLGFYKPGPFLIGIYSMTVLQPMRAAGWVGFGGGMDTDSPIYKSLTSSSAGETFDTSDSLELYTNLTTSAETYETSIISTNETQTDSTTAYTSTDTTYRNPSSVNIGAITETAGGRLIETKCDGLGEQVGTTAWSIVTDTNIPTTNFSTQSTVLATYSSTTSTSTVEGQPTTSTRTDKFATYTVGVADSISDSISTVVGARGKEFNNPDPLYVGQDGFVYLTVPKGYWTAQLGYNNNLDERTLILPIGAYTISQTNDNPLGLVYNSIFTVSDFSFTQTVTYLTDPFDTFSSTSTKTHTGASFLAEAGEAYAFSAEPVYSVNPANTIPYTTNETNPPPPDPICETITITKTQKLETFYEDTWRDDWSDVLSIYSGRLITAHTKYLYATSSGTFADATYTTVTEDDTTAEPTTTVTSQSCGTTVGNYEAQVKAGISEVTTTRGRYVPDGTSASLSTFNDTVKRWYITSTALDRTCDNDTVSTTRVGTVENTDPCQTGTVLTTQDEVVPPDGYKYQTYADSFTVPKYYLTAIG